MKITGFSHYNLRAPRELLDVLCAFYVDVTGLRLGTRPPFASFGYWLYAGEQDVLHLTQANPNELRTATDPLAPNTFDHAAFNCTGRTAFEQKLSDSGIAFELAEVPLTGQVQLFFKDPAGNGVELNFRAAEP